MAYMKEEGIGMQAQRERISFLESLEKQEIFINDLREAVAKLEKRLAPLVRSQPEQEMKAPAPSLNCSSVVSRVELNNDALIHLRDRLNLLENIVEI